MVLGSADTLPAETLLHTLRANMPREAAVCIMRAMSPILCYGRFINNLANAILITPKADATCETKPFSLDITSQLPFSTATRYAHLRRGERGPKHLLRVLEVGVGEVRLIREHHSPDTHSPFLELKTTSSPLRVT